MLKRFCDGARWVINLIIAIVLVIILIIYFIIVAVVCLLLLIVGKKNLVERLLDYVLPDYIIDA